MGGCAKFRLLKSMLEDEDSVYAAVSPLFSVTVQVQGHPVFFFSLVFLVVFFLLKRKV